MAFQAPPRTAFSITRPDTPTTPSLARSPAAQPESTLPYLPSTWLADGWEQGTTRAILMTTEHLDINGVTHRAGGETLKAKLVYEYLGRLEE
ncbi:hypothetical protein PDIDSM_1181 [Penicillium digitatum]|nr:hypothetical protein PDIDSM_1181 [Penicillium digitatum]